VNNKNNKRKVKKMKKILILLTVILVFLVGCESVDQENESYQEEEKDDREVGFAGITKQQCTDANGYWNECGSPCTGTDADFCVQVCQVQCECSGIAGFGCPEGFKCRLTGKIADEIGVCIAE